MADQNNTRIAVAARALADIHADTCGINRDDYWTIYGDKCVAEATAMLASYDAAAPAVPTVDALPRYDTSELLKYDGHGNCCRDGSFYMVDEVEAMLDVRYVRADIAPAFDIDALVNRFLGWPLPDGILPGIERPIGTHLMNADEARAMFEYVLATRFRAEGGNTQHDSSNFAAHPADAGVADAAYERAASVCDRQVEIYPGAQAVASGCAAAIRSLKGAPADPEQAKLDSLAQAGLAAALENHAKGEQMGGAQVATAEQPIIGKLLDDFSALPVLWGLNEPGALVRHSDVFKLLIDAGKPIRLAAPTTESAAAPADLTAYRQAGFDGKEICPTTRGNALAAYSEGIKARAAEGEATERKPLTEPEIYEHYRKLDLPHAPVIWQAALGTARAIEQHHGITGGGK